MASQGVREREEGWAVSPASHRRRVAILARASVGCHGDGARGGRLHRPLPQSGPVPARVTRIRGKISCPNPLLFLSRTCSLSHIFFKWQCILSALLDGLFVNLENKFGVQFPWFFLHCLQRIEIQFFPFGLDFFCLLADGTA